MQQYLFFAFGLIMFLIATGQASGAPGPDAPLEKAFADAHLEVVTSYQRNCFRGKLLAAKPVPPHVLPAMTGMGSLDWQFLAIEARRAAEKLAKEKGRAIGGYLRDAGPNPPVSRAAQAAASRDRTYTPTLSTDAADLLLLLTLDELDMKNETAQAAWRMIKEKGHKSVLLKVSFCSKASRAAAASLLYSKGTRQGTSEMGPAYQNLSGIVGFATAVGNKETAELLSGVAKEQREKGLIAYELENAVKHISARLSLPPEKRSQREADELLFWQTTVGAPGLHALYLGYGVSAAQLVANGFSISPSFLIERVEEIKGFSPQQRADYDGSLGILNSPVLYIIGAQKVDAAIPAMLKLVARRPNLREEVEATLKQIGTPNAQGALRTLATQNQLPENEKR
jgi:hypothetical protein